MSFGRLFDRAVQAASDAGQQALEGVKKGFAIAKDALASTIRQNTQDAVDALAKDATEQFDRAEAALQTIQQVKGKATALYDKASRVFSPEKVIEKPQQCCPPPQSDDGKLFGLKDGKCAVLKDDPKTSTSQTLAKSAVTPSTQAATKTCCDRRFPPGLPRPTVFYVNGIQTTSTSHCKTLHAIADSQCANVIGILNDTAGLTKLGMGGDLRQVAKDRELIKQAAARKPFPTMDGRNPAVDNLSHLIYNDLVACNTTNLYAHSQGGAIASLALQDVRNRLEMVDPKALSNLHVKSFGSAAPLWPDGPNYTHYIHNNDFVGVYTGLGDAPGKRAGLGANMVHFSGSQSAGFAEGLSGRPWIATGSLDDKALHAHSVDETYLGMLRAKEGGCPAAVH